MGKEHDKSQKDNKDKQICRCSSLHIIREVKIKIILRYYFLIYCTSKIHMFFFFFFYFFFFGHTAQLVGSQFPDQ